MRGVTVKRTLLSLALLVWSGCSCGDTTPRLAPVFEVLFSDGASERTSVDFGFVQVGAILIGGLYLLTFNY